jgi:hypothetical protein
MPLIVISADLMDIAMLFSTDYPRYQFQAYVIDIDLSQLETSLLQIISLLASTQTLCMETVCFLGLGFRMGFDRGA